MRAALANDPFAPIDEEERGAGTEPRSANPAVIIPVPTSAPAPDFHRARLGTPSSTWTYRDGDGRILGHAARFDTTNGKDILPLTWCRHPDGRERWTWRAFPRPRPLYGLDRLAARPEAPVLVVEGEKTADAARAIFPDYVAMTWPGGSSGASAADWTALAGRTVVLWPDADLPGRKAMDQAAARLTTAGAGSVRLVRVPDHAPEGWDLADKDPTGLDLGLLLASAEPLRWQPDLPPGFRFAARGLLWQDPGDPEKPEVLVADPFDVLAETRDADGCSWGILLRWRDHDSREHRLSLPRSSLAGDGAEARRALLDGGLYVGPGRKARELLTAFLLGVRCPGRATATNRIGWHASTFVLPDRSIGSTAGEEILLQGTGAVEHAFRQRGSLAEWQNHIARHAIGNSRLRCSARARKTRNSGIVAAGRGGRTPAVTRPGPQTDRAAEPTGFPEPGSRSSSDRSRA